MDIQNREFKKGFRGYNENEVDEFLDRIVADYEKVLRENEKLKEKAGANEKEITHYRGLEQNLQDTLIVAQKTAEDVLNAARKNAKEIRENAATEAQTVHENTIREAQNIRVQAQLDAKRHVDETVFKLTTIVSEYDKLVREKNSFLVKMRAALESELAVVNQLLSSIPTAMEIETLKASAIQAVKNIQSSEIAEKPVEKIEIAKSETKKSTPEKEVTPAESVKEKDATALYKPVKKS
jgi:cell division initiation protein